MEHKEFKDLNNKELLEEKKKIQHSKIVNALIIGLCFGITVFSLVKNGFSFFTFLPLLLSYPFIKNGKRTKILEKEIESRYL